MLFYVKLLEQAADRDRLTSGFRSGDHFRFAGAECYGTLFLGCPSDCRAAGEDDVPARRVGDVEGRI